MTKQDLNALITEEMAVYGINKKNLREKRFRQQKSYMLWCVVRALRMLEYRREKRDSSNNSFVMRFEAFRVKLAERKYHKACEKVGIELAPNMIGKGVRICHDNVVVFGRVGEGCIFHGNNVVGNKRTGASDEIPKLGKRVDVGYGAMIIGNVEIADDCVIGAGAVVTKSCMKPGSILVGVPAKEI